jgi:DNA-binding CsgD family transcriptional regulator
MRRIVVEMPVDEFSRLKGGPNVYREVRSMEALAQLRAGPRDSAAIVRLEFKTPRLTPEIFFRGSGTELQVLDERAGVYTCFLQFGRGSIPGRLGLSSQDGYVVPPITIAMDRARVNFVGTARQIEHFLVRLGKLGVHPRTVSITDLRISSNSPLSVLTERQRQVLTAAYQQGYYDRPRRASSLELARGLGMSSATLVTHRLKAERRLLSVVLGQSGSKLR